MENLLSSQRADEDDGTALQVEDHGQVAMPLTDGDFINGDLAQLLQLRLGEVQLEINLLVSPIKENLVYIAPPGAPSWQMPEEAS